VSEKHSVTHYCCPLVVFAVLSSSIVPQRSTEFFLSTNSEAIKAKQFNLLMLIDNSYSMSAIKNHDVPEERVNPDSIILRLKEITRRIKQISQDGSKD